MPLDKTTHQRLCIVAIREKSLSFSCHTEICTEN
nr:MAG TPA: hypothetical protein [Caudoviricetes sp.]